MPAGAVYLDTSCLLALLRPRDALHADARRVLRSLERKRTPLVTSDRVLAEFLNAAAVPPLRPRAAEAADRLLTDPACTVIPATRPALLETLTLYRARPDKEWSFVDCASITICKSHNIKRVFTHDGHFQQAGFQILLR